MTTKDLDLPTIEAAAREAQAESYGPWQQGASHDEDPSAVYSWPENGVPQSVADCFRRSYALHIATASPSVVLAMVARIRELEGAVDTAIELLDEAGIDNERSQSLTSIRWPAKSEVAKVFRSLLPSDAGKERT